MNKRQQNSKIRGSIKNDVTKKSVEKQINVLKVLNQNSKAKSKRKKMLKDLKDSINVSSF